MPKDDDDDMPDLRCVMCGQLGVLGDVKAMMTRGWPTCCGEPMRWRGQRQGDAEGSGL